MHMFGGSCLLLNRKTFLWMDMVELVIIKIHWKCFAIVNGVTNPCLDLFATLKFLSNAETAVSGILVTSRVIAYSFRICCSHLHVNLGYFIKGIYNDI